MDFAGRIERVRGRFAECRVEAMLISSLKNAFYLSNFSGSTAQILLTEERQLFLTDSRYYERFTEDVRGGYELVPFYQESLGKKLRELADKWGFKRLGVEAEHLSLAQVEEIKENSPLEIVPLQGVVESLRSIKDDEEIAAIRRAIQVKESAFTELLKLVKPEVTEADLAAEFEYRVRKKGAKASSFPPLIAFGRNSSKPHAAVTDQLLMPAMPLTFDLGAELDGYCSDMTRTVFFGGVSQGWREIYNIVREAKEAVYRAACAGMSCKEVDRVARNIIEGKGYDTYKVDGEERRYFGHGLGHGVGIEVHETPRLNARSSEILQPGMVITIEPGIYLPEQGGIRIEDMYLVEDKRLINLNTLPTDIVVVQ